MHFCIIQLGFITEGKIYAVRDDSKPLNKPVWFVFSTLSLLFITRLGMNMTHIYSKLHPLFLCIISLNIWAQGNKDNITISVTDKTNAVSLTAFHTDLLGTPVVESKGSNN